MQSQCCGRSRCHLCAAVASLEASLVPQGHVAERPPAQTPALRGVRDSRCDGTHYCGIAPVKTSTLSGQVRPALHRSGSMPACMTALPSGARERRCTVRAACQHAWLPFLAAQELFLGWGPCSGTHLRQFGAVLWHELAPNSGLRVRQSL